MGAHHSIAEHYRRHRAAFLLAQELGCTPREAEIELMRREGLERIAQRKERLAEITSRHRASGQPGAPEPREWDQPWMMRD